MKRKVYDLIWGYKDLFFVEYVKFKKDLFKII